MKHYILLFFLFAISTNLFSQSPSAKDCLEFHTGTFYLKGMPNIIISRDATTQTESDPSTGRMVKMSVTWTSDCTYELRLIKTNRKDDRKAWKKIKVLVVVITDVSENSYQFSASSAAMAEPVCGTIVKK